MAKKNTSVALPGGLAGLVHAAQQQPQAAPTTSEHSTVEPANISSQQVQAADSRPGQYTAESYREALAEGKSRWDLFCEMGREYHRASNLGAVYIDRDLKRQLGQLRASSLGISTSAILSSIVAQFLLEHGDEVERVIHG